MKTTVKVCGMKDPKLINTTIENGASYIGFIVNYPKSPRSISVNELQNLIKQIPDHIKKVAVMVNPKIEEVKQIGNDCDFVQLHGDEKNDEIKQIKQQTKLKVIKAIKIKDEKDLNQLQQFPDADHLLLDTPAMGQEGDEFNFSLLNHIENQNYFLAGKISINNVGTALKYTDRIDVNSSLETKKGIKDPKKITEFFNKVKSYEN
ncbi:phosphoribosylanthranilate isomerase [Pelagibacteraceae bacterium]|nr:phosphoribosylanthranilate isomerase [Pelagibacteraceae bacterium]